MMPMHERKLTYHASGWEGAMYVRRQRVARWLLNPIAFDTRSQKPDNSVSWCGRASGRAHFMQGTLL
jgi:hypothetical protein